MAVTTLSGCNSPVNPQDQASLDLARQQVQDEKFSSAIRNLNEFLVKHPSGTSSGEAYYLRGLCHRQTIPANEQLAEQDFQNALKDKKDRVIRPLAQVGLGHIYFENHPLQPEKAVEFYLAAISDLSNEPPKDAALYRLGVSLQKMGQWQDADLYLSKCIDKFPDSTFTKYARDRFGARIWSFQFGAFADLNRARNLVKKLQASGWPAIWQTRRKNGSLLYVVRGGRYLDFNQANTMLPSAKAIQPDAEIVAVPLPDLPKSS
ncbi:MAG: tetratricopeptide repeat protein [Sedimentisphaerales bacterium]|nr:tetratricopeptide repeat protein [Sedimentisphaerales bacterium]